jgi:hypothetical protein
LLLALLPNEPDVIEKQLDAETVTAEAGYTIETNQVSRES